MIDPNVFESYLGVSLDHLKPQAKCWVYTSSKPLNELNIEKDLLTTFLQNWVSHGAQVQGSVGFVKNRFIVFFAQTDNTMCGRAQDAVLRFVKELEHSFNTVLLDRMLIGYNQEGSVAVEHLNKLRTKLKNKELSSQTTFYNGLISSKAEFESKWEASFEHSWIPL